MKTQNKAAQENKIHFQKGEQVKLRFNFCITPSIKDAARAAITGGRGISLSQAIEYFLIAETNAWNKLTTSQQKAIKGSGNQMPLCLK